MKYSKSESMLTGHSTYLSISSPSFGEGIIYPHLTRTSNTWNTLNLNVCSRDIVRICLCLTPSSGEGIIYPHLTRVTWNSSIYLSMNINGTYGSVPLWRYDKCNIHPINTTSKLYIYINSIHLSEITPKDSYGHYFRNLEIIQFRSCLPTHTN